MAILVAIHLEIPSTISWKNALGDVVPFFWVGKSQVVAFSFGNFFENSIVNVFSNPFEVPQRMYDGIPKVVTIGIPK